MNWLPSKRNRTRLVLGLGITAGILAALYYVFFRPDPRITFDIFYFKAQATMTGPLRFVGGAGSYHYTPVTILFFYPYVWLFDFPIAVAVHRVLSVAIAVGYGVTIAAFLDARATLERIDRILIVGFVAVNVYMVAIVAIANVGIHFVALLGLGFVLIETEDDWGGALWAVAALIKVFPTLWGLYLLRVRRWRATAAAILTGIVATLIGLLVFGVETHLRYIGSGAGDRIRIERFAGGVSPDNEMVTPIRPLAQVFPSIDPYVWVPVIVVIVTLLTAALFYLVPTDRLEDRTTLLLALVVGITFVMPTSQDLDVYLVYAPLVVLLFTEPRESVHWLYVLGGLFMSYNVGREELRTVAGIFGTGFSEAVMVVGEPVLAFATMPLYGLVLVYAGCLLGAWSRGTESGRVAELRRRLPIPR